MSSSYQFLILRKVKPVRRPELAERWLAAFKTSPSKDAALTGGSLRYTNWRVKWVSRLSKLFNTDLGFWIKGIENKAVPGIPNNITYFNLVSFKKIEICHIHSTLYKI
ncbi:hypothetical protein [aff. Roholtiella sp. LEGE 12411]|uniref:hypothetical protein n=1 Tax=aff. Roholtiella sp. LEGE 12411 TaxID=1828822 RepID=UPI00187FC023|nr:hypothetical protein [aff. Roholtiella sp. LEGE 12411]MBE9038419.1 hypothetical protein [aff. Roholtiella sp. LEGE 12411]